MANWKRSASSITQIILFTADNGTNRSITSRWNGQAVAGGKGMTTDMGTHVPLVVSWKGHSPQGAVCDDMIDFSDFYATFAAAAGVKTGAGDPIDGRSFLPQLKGEKGDPRDWVLLHYQPYWGKFRGQQYVRNGQFKLYRDGRFFKVPGDLKEERDLAKGQAGKRGETVRLRFGQVLESAPPAPPVEGGNKAKDRPVHPAWKNIVNPND